MKHGKYWEVRKGQDTSKAHIDHGTRQPDATHTVPLKTIEAPKPFNETKTRWRAVRYFEPREVLFVVVP